MLKKTLCSDSNFIKIHMHIKKTRKDTSKWLPLDSGMMVTLMFFLILKNILYFSFLYKIEYILYTHVKCIYILKYLYFKFTRIHYKKNFKIQPLKNSSLQLINLTQPDI